MKLKKNDTLYYARILPPSDTFDLYELNVRTVDTDWFTATDKQSPITFLFSFSNINKIIFFDRDECLKTLIEAEEKYRSTHQQEETDEDILS